MTHLGICSTRGCEQAAAAALEVRALCREHFIQECYQQIDVHTRWLKENRPAELNSEAVRNFLSECSGQATELANGANGLDNLERARLLDILLRAAELGHHLRRSPRKAGVEAIRLRSERLGKYWEEETVTRVLSLHGAAVECAHPVEKGDLLLVTRTSTGREARARVAWCQRSVGEKREIGIEILDCENFWEMNWDDADIAGDLPSNQSLSAN